MARYRECPNCRSQSKGLKVIRCSKCGKVYCSNCKGFAFLGGTVCPSCDSSAHGTIGEIDPNA